MKDRPSSRKSDSKKPGAGRESRKDRGKIRTTERLQGRGKTIKRRSSIEARGGGLEIPRLMPLFKKSSLTPNFTSSGTAGERVKGA